MKILKTLSFILFLGTILTTSAFANINPITCKDLKGFSEVKKQIMSLDEKFSWNNTDCKIVGTPSIFPKKNKLGKMQFEQGVQLFVYQNYQLKFICLPGWVCKSWSKIMFFKSWY